MLKKHQFILILSLVLSTILNAKSFKNKFISIELPANFSCQQEELDWVCQPDDITKRSEVIIVFATKSADSVDDTFDKYKEELSKTKTMRDLLGNTYQSKVKYVKEADIRQHPWMDSLQIGSEIPGFVSRYLVSKKEKIAALISYHVAESSFPKWGPILSKMIETAELRFDPKYFAEISKNKNNPLFTRKKKGVQWALADDDASTKKQKPKKSDDSEDSSTIPILLAVAAIIGVVIMRIKKSRSAV